MATELDELRELRRQSKPLSVQLRTAERRVDQKKNAVSKAKIAVDDAEEAATKAQLAVATAKEKVVTSENSLVEAEKEYQRLLRQRTEPVEEDFSLSLCSAVPSIEIFTEIVGDDPDGRAAMEVLRSLARNKSTTAASASSTNTMVAAPSEGLDADMVELERQATQAKRNAERAEGRFQSAKSARSTPYGS